MSKVFHVYTSRDRNNYAELDLRCYGRALLERDHTVITKYGLVERAGGEQAQDMEQQPGPGGMEMA